MSYALITGASKGIGKAMAYDLASRKINLLLTARSGNLLNIIADDLTRKYGVEVKYISIDLSRDSAPEIIFRWANSHSIKINILINNAGYGLSGNFEKYPAQAHAEMMGVNMISLVKLTSLFLPMLKQQEKAYILNVASTAAYQAVPYLSTYAASKSFVVSFSRALQYELRKSNVSVTCISPGGTDTDFAQRADVGKRALKAGTKLNMTPEIVAAIALNSMFNKKREVIAGLINKLGVLVAWLTPKVIAEKIAASLYTDKNN